MITIDGRSGIIRGAESLLSVINTILAILNKFWRICLINTNPLSPLLMTKDHRY